MELIKIENGVSILDTATSEKIAQFERQIKAIKEQEESIKNAILSEMETRGILKVQDEINGLSISYIAETARETFDSKKFKQEHSDMYDEYIKITPVKASIRIKVK